jgi:hypothetical protein
MARRRARVEDPDPASVPTFPRCIGWGRLAQEDADQSSNRATTSRCRGVVELPVVDGLGARPQVHRHADGHGALARSADREGSRPDDSAVAARAGGRGDSIGMRLVIVRQWARMIPLVALFATFVAVATSSTLVCAEAKKATGTTGSSVVVVNTLMFLASTLDTGQLQSLTGARSRPPPAATVPPSARRAGRLGSGRHLPTSRRPCRTRQRRAIVRARRRRRG